MFVSESDEAGVGSRAGSVQWLIITRGLEDEHFRINKEISEKLTEDNKQEYKLVIQNHNTENKILTVKPWHLCNRSNEMDVYVCEEWIKPKICTPEVIRESAEAQSCFELNAAELARF